MPDGSDQIEILYKYRAWDDCGFARSMIEKGQVYFAAPSELNDPFDFAIEPTPPRNASRKEREDYLTDYYMRRSDGKIGKKKAKEKARKKIRELGGKLYIETNFKELLDDAKRDRDETFGVLSLTEDCLSHLMWPHYADSHKGICIGIKASALSDMRVPNNSDWRVLVRVNKMKYASRYPETDIFKAAGGLDEILERQIDTKYAAWEYEKEWRGLMHARRELRVKLRNSDRKVNLGPGAIERVILGIETPAKVAKEVSELIRGLDERPQLFRVERKYDSFELGLKEVQI